MRLELRPHAPKIGKSFLVAQIAYHVSTGQDLWGYKVHQGTVLYLALEDDESRLQRRMFRMFGVEGTSSLHFATNAKMIGGGLDEQLEKFVREHSDTKLIIVEGETYFAIPIPSSRAVHLNARWI